MPYIIGRLVGSTRIETIRILDTDGRIKSSSIPAEMDTPAAKEKADFIRSHLQLWAETESKAIKSLDPNVSYMAIKNRDGVF